MADTLTADYQWTRAHVDRDSSSWRHDPPGTGIPFVASTSGRARDGLELRASGWRTQRYDANSVLLWCHQHMQPAIGRTEVNQARGDKLRGLAYFDQDDDFALKVERKYRSGVMNGFSVGWDFVDGDGRSIDWRRARPDDLRDKAFYDLTEISSVPVPSDPHALTERSRSGMRSLARDLSRVFGEQDTAPAVSGIDQTAARTFLAAFDSKGAT